MISLLLSVPLSPALNQAPALLGDDETDATLSPTYLESLVTRMHMVRVKTSIRQHFPRIPSLTRLLVASCFPMHLVRRVDTTVFPLMTTLVPLCTL